ncbi:Flp pilus assembly protein, secretin CpaC [Candidatus Liberibacter americanus str. Sao Paulo]|uniref:Flp pilus assembly protein, secretin CpaC n=2 Tax=Candidatus Liberibacter americanus TaxID=309868 RepID=U6B3G3_9HYPH|nr:Flp pilus assembly protein, secretin CpaC [Candidatus Liberibacter americanus str. Sao Paulo]
MLIPSSLLSKPLSLNSSVVEKPTVIKIEKSELGTNKRITVGLDKVLILEMPLDVSDVLVSDPNKMSVKLYSVNTVYIFGQKLGRANIIIVGKDKKDLLNIEVNIERDAYTLQNNLRRFIPNSNISVEMISDNIVLNGEVKSAQDSKHAVDLATAFSDKKVLNMLKVECSDQVTLKVTIAEVSREVLKQVGFSHSIQEGSSAVSSPLNFNILSGGSAGQDNSLYIGTSNKYFTLKTFLRALEHASSLHTIAEPTLTAVSGQSASFSSGGERFMRSFDSNGKPSLQSHKYGIELDFTPTVLSPGRIGLRIKASISEPIVNSGEPEYTMRTTETSVELPSGGTIVLAGLLKNAESYDSNAVPLLSQIPILGALFKNMSVNRNATELFIAATPFLVKSVGEGDLVRPDYNFELSSDADNLFLNRVNKVYGSKDYTKNAEKSYKGAIGFIYK